MLLDMYTAMVYSNASVGVFLGFAVAAFVGFIRIQLWSSSIQRYPCLTVNLSFRMVNDNRFFGAF